MSLPRESQVRRIFTLGIMGYCANWIFLMAERRILHWRPRAAI